MLRIGTSGWVYKDWRGLYYPAKLPQRAWFSFYAREFDTAEINNSFYRLPSEAAFDAWRAQAPAGFLYAVKASRYLTHLRKLSEPEEPLALWMERARRLGPTLGPILYQLPPHWRVNVPRLAHFVSILPRGPVHVIEFRDASWFTEEVFALLQANGVAHCLHDMQPLEVPLRVTAPQVYIRFHGVRYAGDYPEKALGTWAERIRAWRTEGLDVYAYFNNDIGGAALRNARTLRELCGRD